MFRRVYFHDEIGWIVLGCDRADDVVRLIGYRIRVDVPTVARTTSRP